ncbi:Hus1-like protein [Coniella lustricola]|uniref:Checkpoint protein n=1 Tax=Coniella lustricola TaxID=2025994 RepID=A0A2T3AJR3_9PEZI|nr:Hus1-like protein [Coniella lustricola]
MRFRTELKNIRTFNKLIAALNTLEKIAWVRLDDDTARFTVIPETGSQVWASLSMDFIFADYNIQSAEQGNTINLELPLNPLQRALKSAINSDHATLRLTKKDGVPVLSMTIHTTPDQRASEPRSGIPFHNHRTAAQQQQQEQQQQRKRRREKNPEDGYGGFDEYDDNDQDDPFRDVDMEALELSMKREREKVITQDIPVRVLHPDTVETIMQPKVREDDVHIQLPPLMQLKAISDRFTKLAASTSASLSTGNGMSHRGDKSGSGGGGAGNPKLELSANMHGSLRLRIATDSLNIESVWHGLDNPQLDPDQLAVPIEDHPSTVFKEAGPDKWATVRVDGKDWSRVLSVGRLEGRVIACFADDHALILYAYVPQFDDATAEDAVVTYYVSSYSA